MIPLYIITFIEKLAFDHSKYDLNNSKSSVLFALVVFTVTCVIIIALCYIFEKRSQRIFQKSKKNNPYLHKPPVRALFTACAGPFTVCKNQYTGKSRKMAYFPALVPMKRALRKGSSITWISHSSVSPTASQLFARFSCKIAWLLSIFNPR